MFRFGHETPTQSIARRPPITRTSRHFRPPTIKTWQHQGENAPTPDTNFIALHRPLLHILNSLVEEYGEKPEAARSDYNRRTFFNDRSPRPEIEQFLTDEQNAARFILGRNVRICTLLTAPDTAILIARSSAPENMTIIYDRHSGTSSFTATIERNPVDPILEVRKLTPSDLCEPYTTNPQHPLIKRDVDELTEQLRPQHSVLSQQSA